MLSSATLKHKNKDELLEIILSTQKSFQEKTEALSQKDKALIQKDRTITQLNEYIRLLKHAQFGRRSEQYIDSSLQGRLFDEASLPANVQEIEKDDVSITVPEHARKKSGRRPLPKDLPRKKIIHDLDEGDKLCACGSCLTPIGEVTTEQLDIIPAKVMVIEHIQKKYACKRCESTIKLAKKPAQPIEKSIATPGLLAHVLTAKFQFHLPLYRQEQMLQSIGAELNRATLSHWIIKSSVLLQPLVNLLQDEMLGYDVAYADESTLQVLRENNKTAISKSYMWCFGGGPPERFSFIYQYHPNRNHAHAINFFREYQGYLHCDGYQAYDALAKVNPAIKQVGCWYHVRRKYRDAAKVSKKPGVANWYLKQIGRLAKHEKVLQANDLTAEEAKNYREEYSRPIVTKIIDKCFEQVDKTPPQSLLGKAITYTLNQRKKLFTFLEEGRLEISNNRMERAIKPFAIGRKNWLFSSSVAGANAAAVIFSLVETCKFHKIDPYDWFRHVLTRLPTCETIAEFEALLPFHFKKEND